MSKSYIQRISQKQERRVADEVGGRTQPASGAMAHAKSDVRKAGELRVECKFTSAKSYSLKLAELDKIAAEALAGGLEVPVLQVQFQKPGGLNRKFAVIDWHEYLDLKNQILHLQECLNRGGQS